jgi:hypothetical protein
LNFRDATLVGKLSLGQNFGVISSLFPTHSFYKQRFTIIVIGSVVKKHLKQKLLYKEVIDLGFALFLMKCLRETDCAKL